MEDLGEQRSFGSSARTRHEITLDHQLSTYPMVPDEVPKEKITGKPIKEVAYCGRVALLKRLPVDYYHGSSLGILRATTTLGREYLLKPRWCHT